MTNPEQSSGTPLQVSAAKKIKQTNGGRLQVSPEGMYLAVCGEPAKWFDLIEVASGRIARVARVEPGILNSANSSGVRFAAQSPRLVTSRCLPEMAPEYDAALWDFEGRLLRSFGEPQKWVTAAAVSPAADRVYTSSRIGHFDAPRATTIVAWDAASGAVVGEVAGFEDEIIDLVASADGNTLYAASANGLTALDVRARQTGWDFRRPADGSSWSGVALSWDQRWLALTHTRQDKESTQVAQLLDAATGQLVREFVHPIGRPRKLFPPCPACFVGDGWMATVGQNNSLCLWDLATGTMLWSLADKKWKLGNLAGTPDGSALFSANHSEGGLLVWTIGGESQ